MPAPTWNDKSELPGRLHSILDILDFFEYVIKNMKHLIIIYQYKQNRNRIAFKIKSGYCLELLAPETMKLL